MSSVTRIFAVGLTDIEKRLFSGICAISQRRDNKLEVLDAASASLADVLLVDDQSVEYRTHKSIIDSLSEVKPLILLDGQNSEYASIQRPVEWSRFPSFLSKILEDYSRPPSNDSKPQANYSKPKANVHQNLERPSNPVYYRDSTIPKILVVDDSLVVRQQLKDILTANNYDVTTASSGEEAYQLFKPDYYHKVLLDVIMPNADGYEVCRKLRSMDKKTPIIMLTSKSSPFDKIRGKMAGCEAYLTKPVVMRYLLKKLLK